MPCGVAVVLDEQRVVVGALVGSVAHPTKAVDVKLPLERRKSCLSEEAVHDALGKSFDVVDAERGAVRLPSDDVVQIVLMLRFPSIPLGQEHPW